MKLLKCRLCKGEMDVIGNERSINKKVRCQRCGYGTEDQKMPEVIVIKKRKPIEDYE